MVRSLRTWRIYLLIAAASLIACGLVFYGFLAGDRLYVIKSPLYSTIEEIEFETVNVRLRMEEAAAGTRKHEEEFLFNHLERSLLYLEALTRANAPSLVESASDGALDIPARIDALKSALATWKMILSQFNSQPPESYPHAQRTAEIATTFFDFSVALSDIEAAVRSGIEKNRTRFRVVEAISIVAAFMLASAASIAVVRSERQRRGDFERLEQTRDELHRELAQRGKVEEALAASERLVRTMFDSSPVAVVVTRLSDHRIVDVNQAFVQTSGYARAEVIGRTFKDIAIWQNPADRDAVIDKLAAGLNLRDLEFPFRMKDGRVRTFLISANVVDIDGAAHILASALDITEHRQKDARMAWLASFPVLNPHPVVEVDIDGRVHYLNPTAQKEFPGLEQQGAGHAWLADWENLMRPFRNGGAQSVRREVFYGGKWYHQALNWVKEARRIRIYGLDITQRKQAEEALMTSHAALETWVNERTQQLQETNLRLKAEVEERARTERSLIKHQMQLRKLSTALVQTEERERRRISTAIHDGIGQTLAAAKIKLGAVRSTLPAGETTRQVDETRDLISAAIQETRSLTFELSLPVLYEIGLTPALEWLSEQFRRKFGLEIVVAGDGCDQRLKVPERVFLFQALRELCFNVVKHAHATRITVSIQREKDNGGIRCDVCDNGIGFDVKKQSHAAKDPTGFGLFSIREHLRQYGGFLTLDTGPDSGTRVVLRLPLQDQEQPAERRQS